MENVNSFDTNVICHWQQTEIFFVEITKGNLLNANFFIINRQCFFFLSFRSFMSFCMQHCCSHSNCHNWNWHVTSKIILKVMKAHYWLAKKMNEGKIIWKSLYKKYDIKIVAENEKIHIHSSNSTPVFSVVGVIYIKLLIDCLLNHFRQIFTS
jgi:hypothetical protein